MSNGPEHISYFGYGSLVNLDTLQTPYLSAHPARLKGWRRVWLSRPAVGGSFAPFDGLAFLSVQPDPDCEIDGMLVVDHKNSLASLDRREALYDRREVPVQDLQPVGDQPLPLNASSYVYVAQPHQQPQTQPSILRSYLDVVFQGYLRTFGQESLQRFVDTTANFHLPIREDRDDPVYPRSVVLSDTEHKLFDMICPSV